MKKTLIILMALLTLTNVYAATGHAMKHANPYQTWYVLP